MALIRRMNSYYRMINNAETFSRLAEITLTRWVAWFEQDKTDMEGYLHRVSSQLGFGHAEEYHFLLEKSERTAESGKDTIRMIGGRKLKIGRALREQYRIAWPDGLILLSFPADEKLESVYEDESITTKDGRRYHFGQVDHLRVFGRDSTALLESFGFSAEEIRGEDCDSSIKPVIGPANYDYNVVWKLAK